MTFSEACEILKSRYRTHRNVARHLNISYEHYCALRSGRANLTPSRAEYVILKAMTAKGEAEAVPATGAVNSVGGQTQTVTV